MATFVTVPRTDGFADASINRDAVTFVGATSLAATASTVATFPQLTEWQGYVAMSPASFVATLGRHMVALPLGDTGDENEPDYMKQGTCYVAPDAVFQMVPLSASITDVYVGGYGRVHIAKTVAQLRDLFA